METPDPTCISVHDPGCFTCKEALKSMEYSQTESVGSRVGVMSEELPETGLAPRVQARIDACIAALHCPAGGVPVIRDPEFLTELRRQLLASQDPAQARAVQLFGEFLMTERGANEAGLAILMAGTVRVGSEEDALSDDSPKDHQVKSYAERFGGGLTGGFAPSVEDKKPEGAIPAHELMQRFRRPGR
jgi:hypothetical protein